MTPHRFSHKFQCGGLTPALCDEGLQDFAFMVDGTPQIVGLPTDLHENLVQVPVRRLSHSSRPALADLVREMSTEPIYPMPNRFVADIEPSLVEEVFHIAQRKRKSDIHHHGR
jgi:hypothetical protein